MWCLDTGMARVMSVMSQNLVMNTKVDLELSDFAD